MTNHQLGPPLRRRRLLLIYALIAVITFGSLFSIVTDTERWPFSAYPMFSWVKREPTVTAFRLFGVTAEEHPGEIPLSASGYLQPFDNSRLSAAFRALTHRDANRDQELSEALQDALRRYEKLRRAGRHSGPQLRGIRLYRLFWELDPRARNVDRPDRKVLIFEITSPMKETP
jgi:hypothetical protein